MARFLSERARREGLPNLRTVLKGGDLVSVNVEHVYGPTSFLVFDAKGKRQEEISEFAALAPPE